MSLAYKEAVSSFADFLARDIPAFTLSSEFGQRGVDALEPALQERLHEARERWEERHDYELSYFQFCSGVASVREVSEALSESKSEVSA